jgi:FixJ family two-component response regulator
VIWGTILHSVKRGTGAELQFGSRAPIPIAMRNWELLFFLPDPQTANDRFVMRTIAVVDDNPSMLQGLNRLLSAHGFRVRTFASAESFLESFAECEADCLLLDIRLGGGISGIDLQRRLTSSGSELPVIMMTAIDNEVTRQEAFDAGCVAYLRKPFLAKLLIDAIGRIP